MPNLEFIEQIIWFLLIITPIVFIHELGHYWVARRSGVVVDVFSIGFGPELYAWMDKSGTRWCIRALPLGGYVKMRGDENAASMGAQTARHLSGSFAGASLKHRMAIVAAGPIANFLFAIVLFAFIYLAVGKSFIPAVIGEVIPNSAAEQAQLQSGDEVLRIDGRSIRDFDDLRALIFGNPDNELMFEILRDDHIMFIAVKPHAVYSERLDLQYGQLGVRSMQGEFRRLGLSEAVITATSDIFYLCRDMLRGIGRLISGQASKGEIGGPVRIAELSQHAATQGWVSVLMFTAIISVNLGLINLLPIPALDGGHLLFFSIEAILGRPVPDLWQGLLMRGGIVLLLTLMIFVTIFDVLRFF